jgi:very-short-patch-repair endonuclease
MAADAALREKLVTGNDIDGAVEGATGWPGVRQARDLLALATPEAESPLESLTRLRLHDDGFPTPELQVWIGRDRVDMLFPAQRLILEIDGLEKYRDDALRREKRREIRLRRQGYRVERVTWDDVVNRWPETSAWLRTILRLPASSG